MNRLGSVVRRLAPGIVLALLTASTISAASGAVLRLKDRQLISWAQMLGELQGAGVVYVGENHDNHEHHQAQLRIINDLREQGAALAIAVEMFPVADQPLLDQWLTGGISEERFSRIFTDRWHIAWSYYRHIFLYARQRRIPMVAINISRDIVKKVAQHGFAALSAAERRDIPAEVNCIIDPTYKAFIRRIFASHQSGQSFDYFCEAQMLWTKSMASHLAAYQQRNPGRTMVVLTGVGHALRPGIPAYTQELTRGSYRIVIPELDDLTRSTATAADLDYLLLNR
jgi:uncharacterized iron-regulated protein